MLDFDNDWDEPDVWSTPTPSPSVPTSNGTKKIVEEALTDSTELTTDDTHPTTAINIIKPTPPLELFTEPIPSSSSLNDHFTASSSNHDWSLESASFENRPFETTSTFGFGSVDLGTTGGVGADDEDEFGDFDDGEIMKDDDDFGGAFAPIQSTLRPSMPIVAFKLTDNLKESLRPALDNLFGDEQTEENGCWSSSTIENDPPSILQSGSISHTWTTLVDAGAGLARPVEWKRSQIRRFHLVHLGIPVDLNDFLAPLPLARQLLSIDTSTTQSKATTSQFFLNQAGCQSASPTSIKPQLPEREPTVDQKRCEEMIGFSEAYLFTQNVPNLETIRDELKSLNQQASDLLTYKLQQRDQSIADSQSYNTMISDLVSAAQRIKMASPGSAKRSSSIVLGSSSIASATSPMWRNPLSRPQPSINTSNNPPPSANSTTTPAPGKRFSMM